MGDVLSGLVEDGFRVNRPVRSETGTWMVDGWSAWELLEGKHDTSGRWADILRVGESLNAALCDLARLAFLDSRTHAWAVGTVWPGARRPRISSTRLSCGRL